jgi:Inhibitor of Apoptosis domain
LASVAVVPAPAPAPAFAAAAASKDFSKFASEEARLDTFATNKWPHVDPREGQMALAGFFMLPPRGNRKDRTQCYHCTVTLSLWKAGDDPAAEHLRASPKCKVAAEAAAASAATTPTAITSPSDSEESSEW